MNSGSSRKVSPVVSVIDDFSVTDSRGVLLVSFIIIFKLAERPVPLDLTFAKIISSPFFLAFRYLIADIRMMEIKMVNELFLVFLNIAYRNMVYSA